MIKVDDTVSGGIAVAAGIALLIATRSFPEVPGEPGPALFPRIASTGLLICGLLIALHGLRHRGEGPRIEWPAWLGQPRQFAGVLVVVAGLATAALAMETIGFFPCAIAIVLGLMLALRVRARVAVPVTLVAVGVVHLIFYLGLRVALPWGLLEPFAW